MLYLEYKKTMEVRFYLFKETILEMSMMVTGR